MKDITIIIPVHEFNDEVGELLKHAIDSVPRHMQILISTNLDKAAIKKLENVVKSFDNCEYINDGDVNSDFCSLVNNAVKDVKTSYFSILEFDDEYTSKWFDNVETYIEYKPEVSVFLPLTDLIEINENRFIGYGNEAPWASSFSNEIGYVDNDCLQQYFDFYLTGAVFNTEDWKTVGGLKPSIKITFWYEFLLRLTNKGKQVFVIPKVGYKHYVNRKGSLYDIYRETVDEKESKWYFELAKKECFYTVDRNKTYENNKEEGE